MNNWQKDVTDFHEKFDCKIGEAPGFPDHETMRLRLALIREEIMELSTAYIEKDFPSFVDAIADSIYVLLGTSISAGVDIRPVWEEVQKTNMAKVPGNSRKDGKVLKPEGWIEPDVKKVLKKQGWKE